MLILWLLLWTRNQKKQVLTAEDIEMDRRVEKAVQTALQEAKNGNKPVAIYDTTSKTVTLQIKE